MQLRPGMETGVERPEMFTGVNDVALNSHRAKSPYHPAFVFYCPQGRKVRGQVFYNEEAWRILSQTVPLLRNGRGSSPDIGCLCSKWKELLEKKANGQNGSDKNEDTAPTLIDTIQRHREKYTVKGILLSGGPGAEKQKRSYLFLVERMEPDSMPLSQNIRQLNLNRRQQEIVHLLIGGLGNKEIAFALGLSLNTIKGYMKLLMGRLGVQNRVGVISTLLMQNSNSMNGPDQFPQSH